MLNTTSGVKAVSATTMHNVWNQVLLPLYNVDQVSYNHHSDSQHCKPSTRLLHNWRPGTCGFDDELIN